MNSKKGFGGEGCYAGKMGIFLFYFVLSLTGYFDLVGRVWVKRFSGLGCWCNGPDSGIGFSGLV